MSENTKLDITGDTAVAQRVVDKLTKQVAKLREELRKTNEETKKAKPDGGFAGWSQGLAKLKDQMDPFKRGLANLTAHQEAYRKSIIPTETAQQRLVRLLKDGASSAVSYGTALRGAMGGAVGGALSLGAAVAVVTAELRDQLRLQQELAKFQQGAAGSQRGFLRNLGVVSNGERTAALQKIGNISQQTGVPETQLYGAATQATAAKGALSNLQALEAVRVAAMVAPDDPSELAATTGGLLDTASLTGSSNAMENLGVIAALGEQTRVGTLKDISENLVPAAIGVKGFGGSTGDAAALVTSMTQATKDTTGRMSGTASISLAKQLAEFMPNEADTASRIAKLQGDPELRKKFMAQASFEAKALIPSRDLITGGTATAELFQQNRGAYATGPAAEAQGRKFIEGLNTTELQENAEGMRRGQQISESLALARGEAGREGGVYNSVNSVLSNAGFGGPTTAAAELGMYVRDKLYGQTTAEAGANTLEYARDNFIEGGRGATESDRAIIQKFDEMIVHLRSLDKKSAPQQRKPNIDAHTE